MKKLILSVLLVLLAPIVFAGDTIAPTIGGTSLSIDSESALNALNAALGDLHKMVNAIAFLGGLILIFSGLASLKAFGQHVTHSSRPGEIAAPIVSLITGSFLIYLPSTLDISLTTIFGDANISNSQEILSSLPVAAKAKWGKLLEIIIKYLQFIGLISFIRGILILSNVGSQNAGQQNSFTKGLTHIVGGTLLINFNESAQIIATLFGLSI